MVDKATGMSILRLRISVAPPPSAVRTTGGAQKFRYETFPAVLVADHAQRGRGSAGLLHRIEPQPQRCDLILQMLNGAPQLVGGRLALGLLLAEHVADPSQ